MHPNAALIQKFYEAFRQKDAAQMGECYHEEASFYDPVFLSLNATQAKAMWAILCEQGKDLVLEYSDISANEQEGSCTWQAHYTFSKTKRKVHNVIKAHFTFKEGKILQHRDHFSFYRWTKMALGLPGLLLGWTPFLQNRVRYLAFAGLKRFMERK